MIRTRPLEGVDAPDDNGEQWCQDLIDRLTKICLTSDVSKRDLQMFLLGANPYDVEIGIDLVISTIIITVKIRQYEHHPVRTFFIKI